MTAFFVERAGNTLRPVDEASYDILTSLPVGKTLHVTVRQPRNPGHHRLFFALCHRIAEAKGLPLENVLGLLKIATGHCTIIQTETYGEMRWPKSISFREMDQTAFREFFERCVQVIYEEWRIDPALVADLLVPQEAT
jgi:hypothetical protein